MPLIKFIKCFSFILLSLQVNSTFSQINFESVNIDDAVQLAKAEKKLIFIDNYASWCAPCKVLDHVFSERMVSDFYNNNFINLKINMDGALGSKMLQEYEVVFLPTLLILDQYGTTISKIERLVTGPELVAIGRDALAGANNMHMGSLNNNPFPRSNNPETDKNIDPNSKEQVIYVYDKKASSGRPHIMYHEAYLHLQLMDGKHHQVVRKYLSTQDDWTTVENIKFIYDFLNNTNSVQFDFFLSNRKRFDEVIGSEKVIQSLSFLIHQRLEQGFPRPSLEEAIKLFQLIDPATAENRAYNYMLGAFLKNDKIEEFIKSAKEYLAEVNPYDHSIIHQYISILMEANPSTVTLNEALELMIRAESLEPQNPEYLFLISKIYFSLHEDTLAKDYIAKAMEAASDLGLSIKKYQELKIRIQGS